MSGPSSTQAGQALTQAVTTRAAAVRDTGDQASGDWRHAGRDRDAGRAVTPRSAWPSLSQRRCRTAKSAGLDVINQSRPGVRAYRGRSAGPRPTRSVVKRHSLPPGRGRLGGEKAFFLDVTMAKLSTCFQRLRPIRSDLFKLSR